MLNRVLFSQLGLGSDTYWKRDCIPSQAKAKRSSILVEKIEATSLILHSAISLHYCLCNQHTMLTIYPLFLEPSYVFP